MERSVLRKVFLMGAAGSVAAAAAATSGIAGAAELSSQAKPWLPAS